MNPNRPEKAKIACEDGEKKSVKAELCPAGQRNLLTGHFDEKLEASGDYGRRKLICAFFIPRGIEFPFCDNSVPDLNWTVAGIGDFNNDGNPDILWRNKSTGDDYVWYMNGVTHAGGDFMPVVADSNWKVASSGN